MPERIEDLMFKGLKIIQNDGLYTFTSDSVILANFIKIKNHERAVEIGTGSGIISILASVKNTGEEIVAFEVQDCLAALARKNVKLNNLEGRIKIIEDKIQNFKKYVKAGGFEVVFSNPPYKKYGSSFLNVNESKAIARHEVELDLDSLVRCASNLLKTKGRFYVVYDAVRIAELIEKLREYKLEPKELFFTYPSPKGDAMLIVIKAVKEARPECKVRPPLVTNDADGSYLEELKTWKTGS